MSLFCVWFHNFMISYCSFRRTEMVANTRQYILIRLSTMKLHNWLLFSFYGSSCGIYRSSFAWNTATVCSKLASFLYFAVLYLFLCSRSSSAFYMSRESTQPLCYTWGSGSCRRKIVFTTIHLKVEVAEYIYFRTLFFWSCGLFTYHFVSINWADWVWEQAALKLHSKWKFKLSICDQHSQVHSLRILLKV